MIHCRDGDTLHLKNAICNWVLRLPVGVSGVNPRLAQFLGIIGSWPSAALAMNVIVGQQWTEGMGEYGLSCRSERAARAPEPNSVLQPSQMR